MILNLLDKLVIGYGIFCLCLIVMAWRKPLSTQARRRITMPLLSSLLMQVSIALSHHKNPALELIELWLTGGAISLILWSLTCDVKKGDIARQKRLDAGIVLKEDRVYNDWAKPDPE